MSISLFKHNSDAYKAVTTMLSAVGKAAVIHPTGTGKSFIAFKLCEDNPGKTVCWLSPSEYIFKTQIENLKAVSDGYAPDNVRFYTYAKLMLMSEDEMRDISPDYIILDEFHRCGAEMWGRGVETLLALFEDVPILGLSATAIRYLDNQRNMADELFDGNVASEITLGEAIVRGILQPPKYVQTVFSYESELGRYEKRIKRAKNKAVRDAAERYLEALRRALEMADGLDKVFAKHMEEKSGKYIVFCSDAEHMREMIAKTGEWFRLVDSEPHVYSVYSDDPETSREFADFKADTSDHLKLLFCIDMLNEGIHVDDVSGVILFRPTISPIIYKQQIGRALAAGKSRRPVIFDIVNNIESLYSIGAIEEEMRVALTHYRTAGESYGIVNERFTVIDEVKECKALFEQLNDTLSASWDMMYDHAKAFYGEHGHLNVPKAYKTEGGYSLGTWLQTQRKVRQGYAFGNLTPERIERLDAIGMRWDRYRDSMWDTYYEACRSYRDTHGSLAVPVSYVTDDGVTLGRWIAQIRGYRKSGVDSSMLTEERISLLDELGMIWNYPEYIWSLHYDAAVRYKNDHGNVDVPLNYVDPEGLKLGRWIHDMRMSLADKNKAYSVTDEHRNKLDGLGMTWENKYELQWNNGFSEAEKYYETHGNLDVPATYKTPDGFKLGDWISNKREDHRKGKLNGARKEKLDTLGMIWEKPDPWELRYAMAAAFYSEHGHLRVPANYKVGKVNLHKWVNDQKQVYRGKRAGKALSIEQISRLESIGIDWYGLKNQNFQNA